MFFVEKFWKIQPEIHQGSMTYKLLWGKGRLFDRDIAKVYLDAIKTHTHATITNVKSKEAKRPRPIAFNTVELLKLASKKLSIGPHEALHVFLLIFLLSFIYTNKKTTQK